MLLDILINSLAAIQVVRQLVGGTWYCVADYNRNKTIWLRNVPEGYQVVDSERWDSLRYRIRQKTKQMKITVTETTVTFYGHPSAAHILGVLSNLSKDVDLNKLAVITGAIDPLDKARFEAWKNKDNGEIDLSKNYFAGCTPEDIERLRRELKGKL